MSNGDPASRCWDKSPEGELGSDNHGLGDAVITRSWGTVRGDEAEERNVSGRCKLRGSIGNHGRIARRTVSGRCKDWVREDGYYIPHHHWDPASRQRLTESSTQYCAFSRPRVEVCGFLGFDEQLVRHHDLAVLADTEQVRRELNQVG